MNGTLVGAIDGLLVGSTVRVVLSPSDGESLFCDEGIILRSYDSVVLGSAL